MSGEHEHDERVELFTSRIVDQHVNLVRHRIHSLCCFADGSQVTQVEFDKDRLNTWVVFLDLVDDRLDLGFGAASKDDELWLTGCEEGGSLCADATLAGSRDDDYECQARYLHDDEAAVYLHVFPLASFLNVETTSSPVVLTSKTGA